MYRILLIIGFVYSLSHINAQVVINEYSASNWGQFIDNYDKHEDWVELFNSSVSSFDVSGYYLTDDPSKTQKWKIPSGAVIPPKGFFRIWLSGRNVADPGHYHANFKLTQTLKNTETLVLSDPSNNKVDEVKLKITQNHQSMGRKTDGSTEWWIFKNPTIEASNNTEIPYRSIAKTPKMNKKPGFYSGQVIVGITTSEADGIIHYTTDGTEPDENSEVYTDSLVLMSTTVLKAKVYTTDPEELPSFTEFNTYFIDINHTLPVVSVSGNMLTELANGDNTLRPQGNFEFFDLSKERKANGGGEFNSHGQDSWANDQRSLDWISRDEFGYGYALKEKFFKLTERDEFQRIILRAAGDDNYPAANHPQNAGSAHIRDAYVHNLAKEGGMHLDVREGSKAVVYLNGAYWGVYDLREIPDDHDYTDFNYKQGKYDLQYLLTWGGSWAGYGGQKAFDDWYELYNFIFDNDMADPDNYAYVKSQYDVTSLVDYVIVNSFTVCTDWLNYNTGWWRGLNSEGGHQKWGYILWDNDATFGHYINYTGVPNITANAKPCNPETLLANWQDPEGHIKILNRLRTNPEFNQYYLSRQMDMMNTVFSCENMLSRLDSIIATLKPEMAQHAQRWFGSYNGWLQNANKLRNFISARCNFLQTSMDDCYNTTGPFKVAFQVDPPGSGHLKVNTLDINGDFYASNYLGGIETKLIATPDEVNNYVFDYWTSSAQDFQPFETSDSATVNLVSADTITAHFKLKGTSTDNFNSDFSLFRITPSLFKTTSKIEFMSFGENPVWLKIYSAVGTEVYTLVDGERFSSSLANSIVFDPSKIGLPAGIYFLKLSEGHKTKIIRAIYMPD
ncbi:MAG: CotH kinase family protein [Saprospiraceae bacterium]|nr:CotH kinase family protein [Saprospiraceae bacterium]